MPACHIEWSCKKFLCRETQGGDTERICLHLVQKSLQSDGGEGPRGRGEFGFVGERVIGSLSPPPLSCTLVPARKADRQSELIVTHLEVFISATTHGYQMCWEARDRTGEASREGGETSASLENSIKQVLPLKTQWSAFCFQVYCVKRNEREGSLGRWNASDSLII